MYHGPLREVESRTMGKSEWITHSTTELKQSGPYLNVCTLGFRLQNQRLGKLCTEALEVTAQYLQ